MQILAFNQLMPIYSHLLKMSKTHTLSMKPLPVENPDQTLVSTRWKTALKNVQEAQHDLNHLKKNYLDEAIYLDEDDWKQAAPTAHTNLIIQAQHQRIQDLETELLRSHQALHQSNLSQSQLEQQLKEFQEELDRNSKVFELHYSEIITKNKEIEDLRGIINTLDTTTTTDI
jgi:small-conductance mechanosensitive channel